MAKRKESATVDLKVRMKEPLRASLERAARQRGVSMNAEAVDRLERSLAKEDELGGPRVANMARLMASAFLRGGQRAAEKHPEWTPAEWMNDPICYDMAAMGVIETLLALQPEPYAPEITRPEIRRIRRRMEQKMIDLLSRRFGFKVRVVDDKEEG